MAKKDNDLTVASTKKETISEFKETTVKEDKPKTRTTITKGIHQTLVYCGPTIKGVVNQNAHFSNGLTKRLKEYSEKNKDVLRLIVPIEKFIETLKNIKISGTIENFSYNKILKGE